MFRIDNATAAPGSPTYPAPGTPGHFTKGDPGAAVPATVVDDWFLDQVQEELCAVVTSAGLGLGKSSNNQVRDGILAASGATDTGAANAYVVTFTPAVAGYLLGLTITFKAANSSSGGSTLNVNGLGAKAIVRPDGSALTAGDILAGQLVTVRYDGTSFQLVADGRAVGNNAGFTQLSANTALTAGQAGRFINITGSGTVITLPAASAMPRLGSRFVFYYTGSTVATVSTAGADTIYVGTTTRTSIILTPGDTLVLNNISTAAWTVESGSASLPFSGLFGSALSSPGYQKLPSGLIFQWGGVVGNAGTPVTYPIAFPNTVLSLNWSFFGNTGSNYFNSLTTNTASGFTPNVTGTWTGNWQSIGY